MSHHKCINCGYEILPNQKEESIFMSRQVRYYHETYEGCQSAMHRKGVQHPMTRKLPNNDYPNLQED